jgi:hypothetical protein
MVKLRGPMMSLAASGSLAKTVTYGKALGRAWGRRLVKPGNPQTGAQISARAVITWLSQQWAGLSTANKATWQSLADASQVAPYHAYCKINAQRHRSGLTPGKTYPVTGGVNGSSMNQWVATAGVREITLRMSSIDEFDPSWGFLIYTSMSTGFTPAFDNALHFHQATGGAPVTWIHGPLEPGTYYYNARGFDADGNIGDLRGERNATVS